MTWWLTGPESDPPLASDNLAFRRALDQRPRTFREISVGAEVAVSEQTETSSVARTRDLLGAVRGYYYLWPCLWRLNNCDVEQWKAADRVVFFRDTQRTAAIVRDKGAAKNFEDIPETQNILRHAEWIAAHLAEMLCSIFAVDQRSEALHRFPLQCVVGAKTHSMIIWCRCPLRGVSTTKRCSC